MPVAAAALLVLSALAVTPAQRLEAEQFARQSITDYNVGDFDAALQGATAAYKLDPRPALLFNLGQVHRALHHWERAEFFFRGYLRGKRDAPNRAAVEKLIHEMETKQAEAARPGSPPTVTITPLPPAPKPTPAAPEQVPLVIESPQTASPPPAAPAPAAPALQPLEQPHTLTAAEPGVSGDTPPPEPKTRSHTAAYILGGVALAAAGVAVAGLVETLQYNQFAQNCSSSGGSCSYAQLVAGTKSGSGGVTRRAAGNWAVTGYVLGGVAVAGLVGAIIAW